MSEWIKKCKEYQNYYNVPYSEAMRMAKEHSNHMIKGGSIQLKAGAPTIYVPKTMLYTTPKTKKEKNVPTLTPTGKISMRGRQELIKLKYHNGDDIKIEYDEPKEEVKVPIKKVYEPIKYEKLEDVIPEYKVQNKNITINKPKPQIKYDKLEESTPEYKVQKKNITINKSSSNDEKLRNTYKIHLQNAYKKIAEKHKLPKNANILQMLENNLKIEQVKLTGIEIKKYETLYETKDRHIELYGKIWDEEESKIKEYIKMLESEIEKLRLSGMVPEPEIIQPKTKKSTPKKTIPKINKSTKIIKQQKQYNNDDDILLKSLNKYIEFAEQIILNMEKVKDDSNDNKQFMIYVYMRSINTHLESLIKLMDVLENKIKIDDSEFKKLLLYVLVFIVSDIKLNIDFSISIEQLDKILSNMEIEKKQFEKDNKKLTITQLKKSLNDILKEYPIPQNFTNSKPPINNILLEVQNKINDVNKFLETGRKNNFKTQEQINNFESLINAVVGFDYYPTPSKYSEIIYNDVKEWYGEDIDDIKVLDIACGFLSLSMPYIERGIKTLLNEFSVEFYNVIKPLEKLPNVSIVRDDFTTMKDDFYFKKDINIIVMNPPFSAYIDEKNEPKAYLFFIMKAIDILSNSSIRKYDNQARFLYVICPKTEFSKVEKDNFCELNIPQTIIKKGNRIFNMDWNDGGSIHIKFMGDVNGFKTIRKGKPVNMALTVGLYKFEIL